MATGRTPEPEQLTPVERAIARFKRIYSQATDFVTFHPPESLSGENDDPMMWEFRVAILPTRENLNLAVETLLPYLAEQQLVFKFLGLNEAGKNSIDTIHWDAISSLTYKTSDRDQRGKELCIYVKRIPNTDAFEKSPEELKEMMLTILLKLQQAKVAFGYVSAPAGDKEIVMDHGILPGIFSYTAMKPWKGPNGILIPEEYKQEAMALLSGNPVAMRKYDIPTPPLPEDIKHAEQLPDHNPCLFSDPFEGIYFTQSDLKAAGIQIKQLEEVHTNRITETQNHSLRAREIISNFLKQYQNKPSYLGKLNDLASDTFYNRIAELVNQFHGSEEDFLNQPEIRQLRWLGDMWPRAKTPKMDYAPTAVILLNATYQLVKVDKAKGLAEFRAAMQNMLNNVAELEGHKQDLINRFADYSRCEVFRESLLNVFAYQPAEAQLLFRGIIHLDNEQNAIEVENTRRELRDVFAPLNAALAQLNAKEATEKKLLEYLEQLKSTLLDQIGALIKANHPIDENPQLVDFLKNHTEGKQMLAILNESKIMVDAILSPTATQEQKLASVERFEKNVRRLPCLKKATWRHVAKAVACVILAAVGAILGAVIGFALEASLMAAISAPVGGVLGLFGAVHGAITGGMTGWAIGMLCATAVGLTAGGVVGIKLPMFNDDVDRMKSAAKQIAVR